MDQMMGAGDGGMGGQAGFPLETWFWEMPLCTRWWTTATVLTSALVQCQIINPFQLFYSFQTVFYRQQYWRLLTTFLYFGPLSLDLVFHIFFLTRYSRLLEESTPSPAHYTYFLFLLTLSLLALSPLLSLPFLGSPLSSTFVYIWSRRNPDTRLSFLGLLVFTAPYLPWVLMAFSLAVHGRIPRDELAGAALGHIWWFFSDVYPRLNGGYRPLDPPGWWRRVWEGPGRQATVEETGGDGVGVETDIAVAAAPEVH